MKKVLFGLFALSTVALANETNIYIRTGLDLNGKYDTITGYDGPANEEKADEISYEFAIEATKEISNKVEFGLGLAYQKHGEPKEENYFGGDEYDHLVGANYDIPGYTSIPVYFTLKYKFDAVNNFIPYIKGNLGYSFNMDDGDGKYTPKDFTDKISKTYSYDIDMKNGLYYGIGAGFEYNNFTLDLMYQVNEATAEISDKEAGFEHVKTEDDFDYSRLTLGFGYKFNF